jgi:AraC-like DNA-binding protein
MPGRVVPDGKENEETISFNIYHHDRLIQLEFTHVKVSIDSSPESIPCMQISFVSIEDPPSTTSTNQIQRPFLLLEAIKFFSEIVAIFDEGEIHQFRDILKAFEGKAQSLIEYATPMFPDIPRFKDAFDYIESNYDKPISLRDVATFAGYSPAYLTNAIHRITGYSVNHWILRRRMQKAKHLLKETNFSVERIAETVGYRSTSHFFRQFHKLFNVSPQVWRKSEREPRINHS